MSATSTVPAPQNLSQFELLRVKQVVQIVAVSRSTWLSGVRSGRFPKPLKLSPRVTVWRKSDLQALIDKGVT